METSKFTTDSVVNIASLVVLFLSGVILCTLIPRLYGVGAFGAFNQVFSVYILVSQIGTWGIQASVLRHLPDKGHKADDINPIIVSSLLEVLPFAVLAGFLTALSSWPLGLIMDSQMTSEGLLWASPGVVFFAFNKVMLNVLNGLQYNKLYAFFVGLRYALLPIILVGLSYGADLPAERIPVILTGAELILFVSVLACLKQHIISVEGHLRRQWGRRHRNFGFQAMWGGLASELNTRVDILVLGFFLDDKIVGIYSIVAFLIEMAFHLPVAVRKVIDPVLVQKDRAWIERFVRHGQRISLGVMFLAFTGGIFLYPIIIPWYMGDSIYASGWHPFIVLSTGALLYSSYAPFMGLLAQSGHPREQSLMTVVGLGINMALNLALVPYWGMNGAATATAVAYVSQVLYYRHQVKNILRIRI